LFINADNECKQCYIKFLDVQLHLLTFSTNYSAQLQSCALYKSSSKCAIKNAIKNCYLAITSASQLQVSELSTLTCVPLHKRIT